MSIVIIGGPNRGKSSLAKRLAETTGLLHRCTDPQHLCKGEMIGTPSRLGYGDVSQWVADQWMPLPNLIIEGVHGASGLLKYMSGSKHHAPVTRVIYMPLTLGYDSLPGHIRQTEYVEKRFAELKPAIESILEFWVPDGQQGFKEVPRVSLVAHTPSVQRPKTGKEKRAQYRR